MSDIAISVSRLGKWFDTARRANGLREALVQSFRSLGQRPEPQGIWAVRDITFDVNKGEIVGLIGHNGAGKSVLLKILSGITNPTEGSARIHGRIGALLELGTGFHLELSGHDNIFLNGSFLGMRPWEIEEKYEDIVRFSGIEHALDEPVKHYSSGMMMRLAFSIAANLAPEVIFLDEVWAVGDIDFQQRAFAKMQQLISSGRTVIIVSHSLDIIRSICSKCILLERGRIKDIGRACDVVDRYLAAGSNSSVVAAPISAVKQTPGVWQWPEDGEPNAGRLRLLSLQLLNSRGEASIVFPLGEAITIEFTYEPTDPTHGHTFVIGLQDPQDVVVLTSRFNDAGSLKAPHASVRRVRCTFPGTVASMRYKVLIMASSDGDFTNPSSNLALGDVITFDVLAGSENKSCPPNFSSAVMVDAQWFVEPLVDKEASPPARQVASGST